jgi:hypothetical protein
VTEVDRTVGPVKEKTVLRWCAFLIPVAAFAVPFAFGRPKKLPSAALGSFAFLHFEESLALLLGFILLVMIVLRLWRGELPIKVNSRGAEFQATTLETTDVLVQQTDKLQVQMDYLQRDMGQLSLSQRQLDQLAVQMDALQVQIFELGEEIESILDYVTSA